MKSHHKIALALLVGASTAVAAIEGLRAQATPPTYLVVAIRSVTDPDAFKTVLEKAPATIAAGGGEFIIRTDKITSLDGKAPQRFVVLRFDSPESPGLVQFAGHARTQRDPRQSDRFACLRGPGREQITGTCNHDAGCQDDGSRQRHRAGRPHGAGRGAAVHVTEWGEGPPLLMLHGNPDSGIM